MNAFISWQVLINDALNDDVVKKYNFSYSCLFSQFLNVLKKLSLKVLHQK